MKRLAAIAVLCAGVPGFAAWQTDEQSRQYAADVPKTILELQQFRVTSSMPVRTKTGREGVATLVNLNPAINVWYVLRVAWKDGTEETAAHLENPKPQDARLSLDAKYPSGIVITEGKSRYSCELFAGGLFTAGTAGVSAQLPAYRPLCEGRIYMRNPVKGRRTALESTVEYLRDQVWGGENVISVFHHLLADRYRETGELQAERPAVMPAKIDDHPMAGVIDPELANRRVMPKEMGIELAGDDARKNGMLPGTWYAAMNPGMWVSIVQPNFLAPAIFQTHRNVVQNLDSTEAASLCYLVAFDLDQFDVEYALGTQYPEVTWSERAPAAMRNAQLPGPDGIGNVAPLVSTGLIRPDKRRATEAAFIGGFKRSHGAFSSGVLARINHASHYGFIENGVVFSKLQPGLATVYVLEDGSVGMKTWAESDNAMLARIRHARQNGVPLIETEGVPGGLVGRWGAGNWSGSENEKLRSIRAAMALQKSGGKKYLIYALFSSATPSAMARVLQAYRVEYGMLLDMNALEHTYLAIYRRSANEMTVDHLLKGMDVLDKSGSNDNVPRFLGYPDNRDFFYLTRRTTKVVRR